MAGCSVCRELQVVQWDRSCGYGESGEDERTSGQTEGPRSTWALLSMRQEIIREFGEEEHCGLMDADKALKLAAIGGLLTVIFVGGTIIISNLKAWKLR